MFIITEEMRYRQKLCEYVKNMELQKPQGAIIQIVMCTGNLKSMMEL
ncbi:hypothetical protein SAMN02910278_02132 [Peptostreptococcus sp. D1]|nr:hypothetical protein SAMN02910278_02132 [Peptostreptococcus sp. D1]